MLWSELWCRVPAVAADVQQSLLHCVSRWDNRCLLHSLTPNNTRQQHTLLLKTEEVSISTVTEKLTWWSAFMCSFINDQPEKNKNIIQDDNDNNKEIFRFIHAGELGTNCYPSENHSIQTHTMINVMLCNLLTENNVKYLYICNCQKTSPLTSRVSPGLG